MGTNMKRSELQRMGTHTKRSKLRHGNKQNKQNNNRYNIGSTVARLLVGEHSSMCFCMSASVVYRGRVGY